MQDIALEEISEKKIEDYNDDVFDISKNKEIINIDPEEEDKSEEIEIIPEAEDFEEVEMTAAEGEADEFLPMMPATGKVLEEFSGDNLVYYETLDDRRVHSGIDIEAEIGSDVYASEDGVVEKIYSNNLGVCILVDHKNEYKSLYANLDESNLVCEGDEVCAGQTIGRVGENAVGDKTAKPHVHFEMHYKNQPVNPLDIITIE